VEWVVQCESDLFTNLGPHFLHFNIFLTSAVCESIKLYLITTLQLVCYCCVELDSSSH